MFSSVNMMDSSFSILTFCSEIFSSNFCKRSYFHLLNRSSNDLFVTKGLIIFSKYHFISLLTVTIVSSCFLLLLDLVFTIWKPCEFIRNFNIINFNIKIIIICQPKNLKFSYKTSEILKNYFTLLILRIISIFIQIFTTF